MTASEMGHDKIVEVLLAAGANIDFVNKVYYTCNNNPLR